MSICKAYFASSFSSGLHLATDEQDFALPHLSMMSICIAKFVFNNGWHAFTAEHGYICLCLTPQSSVLLSQHLHSGAPGSSLCIADRTKHSQNMHKQYTSGMLLAYINAIRIASPLAAWQYHELDNHTCYAKMLQQGLFLHLLPELYITQSRLPAH